MNNEITLNTKKTIDIDLINAVLEYEENNPVEDKSFDELKHDVEEFTSKDKSNMESFVDWFCNDYVAKNKIDLYARLRNRR